MTAQFEDLRIQEDDNIAVSKKVEGIASKAFWLGEIYSKEKLVKKTIRSLPVRFRAKVAVIEEAKDVTKMSFDDLVGSMQTYKMNLDATSQRQRLGTKT